MPITTTTSAHSRRIGGMPSWRSVTSVFWLALVVTAASCGPSSKALRQASPHITSTTLSVNRLFCQSCSSKVTALLETLSGVHDIRFDRKRVEFSVAHAKALEPGQLIDVVQAGGFDARLGPGQGSYEVPVDHPETLDVELISRGKPVDLDGHIVPGKVTVFDFYADWCGPCRQVAEAMNEIMSSEPRIALRKVDIIDWDTSVARQHLKRVPQLPFVVVYGPDGKLLDKISGLKLERLKNAIQKGLK